MGNAVTISKFTSAPLNYSTIKHNINFHFLPVFFCSKRDLTSFDSSPLALEGTWEERLEIVGIALISGLTVSIPLS